MNCIKLHISDIEKNIQIKILHLFQIFLDSLWFSIEGELNRNGYNAAKKYVEEAELIELK